jgi:hypothetical protein
MNVLLVAVVSVPYCIELRIKIKKAIKWKSLLCFSYLSHFGKIGVSEEYLLPLRGLSVSGMYVCNRLCPTTFALYWKVVLFRTGQREYASIPPSYCYLWPYSFGITFFYFLYLYRY